MLSVCIWDFILWSVTRHQSLRNLAFDLIFVIEIYILCVWLCHVRIARSIEHTHTVPDIPEYLRRQPPRPQSRPARKHTHGGSQLPRVAMGSAPMEDDLIVELSSMSSALWVPEGSLTDMKAFLIERLPHWMANVTSFTDAKEYILQNLIIIRDQACEGWYNMPDREYLNAACEASGYVHEEPAEEEVGEPWLDLALGTLIIATLVAGLFLKGLVAKHVAGRRLQQKALSRSLSCPALVELKSTRAVAACADMLLAFDTLDDGIARATKAASVSRPKSPSQRGNAFVELSGRFQSLEPLKEAQLIEMESRWSFPRPVSTSNGGRRPASAAATGGERKRAPCVPPEVVVEEVEASSSGTVSRDPGEGRSASRKSANGSGDDKDGEDAGRRRVRQLGGGPSLLGGRQSPRSMQVPAHVSDTLWERVGRAMRSPRSRASSAKRGRAPRRPHSADDARRYRRGEGEPRRADAFGAT